MIKNLLFLFLILFCLKNTTSLFAQSIPKERVIDSLSQAEKQQLLYKNWSFNKVIIEELRLEILTALSFFPELKNEKIRFKKANINTTMNARPSLLSLVFRKKENRTYFIRITKKRRNGSITLDGASFNAKVGVLAHELCHIVDYKKRDFIGILERLFDYTNKQSVEKFEKEIDQLTIKHGLGWQLYAWSYFVLNESKASKKYKAFKEDIYLEPFEILELIKKSENY